uniref:MULE transposase domain-containing protein n=1 Tax=Ditylenchus dipsaci TaxID=166011 RepID=A0A915DM51_9BILA
MIRAMMPNFEPNNINVDFEQAVINSLRETFPDANVNGCFYHLMKNFKKQIGEAGLTKQYRDPETNFALMSRMLMSLAFVPPLEVYECFRQLEVYLMREEPLLEPVITWFSRNYVGLLCDLRRFQFICGLATIEHWLERIGRITLLKLLIAVCKL